MSRYTKSMTHALQQVDDHTKEFEEEVKWEVKITGLPTFYSDGKSRGEVKQALRKLLKRPDDIESIERTTPAALKKIRRGQASGKEPGEEESEKVKEEVKLNRIIKAQNEALNVDDIVNMIQFGHPFKVAEDIPAELPPGPDIPKYKDVSNATFSLKCHFSHFCDFGARKSLFAEKLHFGRKVDSVRNFLSIQLCFKGFGAVCAVGDF